MNFGVLVNWGFQLISGPSVLGSQKIGGPKELGVLKIWESEKI